jgi:hypothetical protein
VLCVGLAITPTVETLKLDFVGAHWCSSEFIPVLMLRSFAGHTVSTCDFLAPYSVAETF